MTEENRRKRRRWTDYLGYVIGGVLLAIAVGFIVHENHKINHQSTQIATQQGKITTEGDQLAQQTSEINDLEDKLGTSHQQLVDGCKRQVIRDVEANISNHADWVVDGFFLQAVEHPLVPPPNAKAQALSQAFIQPIKAAVASKVWIPITDCERVVAVHGSRYKLPKPVPFNEHQPPKAAVTLNPRLFQ